jgi:hypothetical protein
MGPPCGPAAAVQGAIRTGAGGLFPAGCGEEPSLSYQAAQLGPAEATSLESLSLGSGREKVGVTTTVADTLLVTQLWPS